MNSGFTPSKTSSQLDDKKACRNEPADDVYLDDAQLDNTEITDSDDISERILNELRNFLAGRNKESNDRVSFDVLNEPPSETLDLEGRAFGNYWLHRMLGVGGMGSVYLATQNGLKRQVAIKLLNSMSEMGIQRFENEANIAANLNHPNIVQAFDFGFVSGYHYIAMQFVEGPTLEVEVRDDDRKLVPNHELRERVCGRWELIAKIGRQIASALAYAHAQGTIHRDIKPANILLDENDNALITDFGIAKLDDEELDLTMAGEAVGSPRYMAPEQFHGLYDERSDVYGLGITLYELACGQRAGANSPSTRFYVNSRIDLELQHVQEIAPDVPDALAEIIMQACKHNPVDRTPSANIIRQQLEDYSNGTFTIEKPRKPSGAKLNTGTIFLALLTVCFWATVGTNLFHELQRSNRMPQASSASSIVPDGVAVGEHKFEINENKTFVATLNDDFEIQDEYDGLSFEIVNRQLLFANNPDFENPSDFDGDSEYLLSMTDAEGHSILKTISVLNVNEPPALRKAFNRPIVAAVGKPFVGAFRLNDPEAMMGSFKIVGGLDADRFYLSPSSGQLFFKELPTANAYMQAPFHVTVSFSDHRNSISIVKNAERGHPSNSQLDLNSLFPPDSEFDGSSIRSIWSTDGKWFYHVHQLEDRIALFRSKSDSEHLFASTELVSSDCQFPTTGKTIATQDGKRFVVLSEQSQSSVAFTPSEETTPPANWHYRIEFLSLIDGVFTNDHAPKYFTASAQIFGMEQDDADNLFLRGRRDNTLRYLIIDGKELTSESEKVESIDTGVSDSLNASCEFLHYFAYGIVGCSTRPFQREIQVNLQDDQAPVNAKSRNEIDKTPIQN